MWWIFFICKGSTSYIESINQSASPKKNICWYGAQKLSKNLNIYLRKYQTEKAIFLATKHEKTIMACSYLNSSIRKIHQNSTTQNGDFYEYGANSSEAVQTISTRTLLELCQLTKTADFKATSMKKHI